MGGKVKQAVKYAMAHVLYSLGLLQLWQRVVLRQKAVILMYHRVLTVDEMRRSGSHPAMIVESQTFAKQMAVIRKRFNVLSIEDFAARMEQKIPFEDSSCLITFDDGWRDNFTNALPILRKYEIPAVVFLPVNFIGENRLFWQESLVQLLVLAVQAARKNPASKSRLSQVLNPIGLESILDIEHADPRSKVIERISRNRAGWLPSLIDSTISGLRRELGVEKRDGQETDGFLSWDQVTELTRENVVFGGHGAEHQLLSEMPIDAAREDIRLSKAVIDLRCKAPVPTFSYPRGYRNPQVVELVKAEGFRLGFIANGGRVSSVDDPFTLRRINIFQDATASTPMFLARILGLF